MKKPTYLGLRVSSDDEMGIGVNHSLSKFSVENQMSVHCCQSWDTRKHGVSLSVLSGAECQEDL